MVVNFIRNIFRKKIILKFKICIYQRHIHSPRSKFVDCRLSLYAIPRKCSQLYKFNNYRTCLADLKNLKLRSNIPKMGEKLMLEASEEEEDILQSSTKRCKEYHQSGNADNTMVGETEATTEEPKISYRDTFTGQGSDANGGSIEEDLDGEVSDDDEIEEGDKVT